MAISLQTNWLGLTLKNPVVLASLTTISHATIDDQVQFYIETEKNKAGAIILESVIPRELGNGRNKWVQNDLIPLESGLGGSNQPMGIGLLGPPYPNVSCIKYGIELVKKAKEKIKIPIIGSIINLGTESEMIQTAKEYSKLGIDALELNFSCPNVVLLKNDTIEQRLMNVSPSIELIKKIKNESNLEISVKVSPNSNYNQLLNYKQKSKSIISSISYSNAYFGLTPPSLEKPFGGKFGRTDEWSFTGIYGPLERFFTYAEIAKFKRNIDFRNVQFSAIGGFVDSKHLIEALLLGADTVQFASGILWRSLNLIRNSVVFLEKFMKKNDFDNISAFRGKSLEFLKDNASMVKEYSVNGKDSKPSNQRLVSIISNDCISCFKCINLGCLAIKKIGKKVKINKDLCSGCGWCRSICKLYSKGAIHTCTNP